MADYNKLAATALALIKKSGKLYAVKRVAKEIDGITGIPSLSTTTSGNLTAVVLPRYKGFTFSQLDDAMRTALIMGKLRTVLAAAKDAPFEPQPLDLITIDGKDWQVIGNTPLSPAGIPLIYTIGVILK